LALKQLRKEKNWDNFLEKIQNLSESANKKTEEKNRKDKKEEPNSNIQTNNNLRYRLHKIHKISKITH